MKKLIVLFVITFIIISCQKKAIPVITERKDEPKKEAQTIIVSPDTLAGRSIFMARCDRCHDLPDPAQYTEKRWDGILSYMIPRARLSNEQGVHVTAYLRANSKK